LSGAQLQDAIGHKFLIWIFVIGQVSVRIKMKAFTTLIILSILAAAANASQVDEPVSSRTRLYFDYIVLDDDTLGLAKDESNVHWCTHNFRLRLVFEDQQDGR
jgi:hypothetical protein